MSIRGRSGSGSGSGNGNRLVEVEAEPSPEALAALRERVREYAGLRRVVLSGGVFQNGTLLRNARDALGRAGFTVFSHHVVPPNDGGIALGQAVVAQARVAEEAR